VCSAVTAREARAAKGNDELFNDFTNMLYDRGNMFGCCIGRVDVVFAEVSTGGAIAEGC
jgi:hypothetical protein